MVQVHPTDVVKPDDPEAFGGAGGLVCDLHGNRFDNASERREYVTGEMWKNKLHRLGGHSALRANLSSCVVVAP